MPLSKKSKIIISIFVAILVMAFLIYSENAAANIYYHASIGKSALFYAQSAALKQDLSGMTLSLKLANDHFEAAQNSYHKLSFLRLVPFVSLQYRAGSHLLKSATLISSSLLSTTDVARDILGTITFRGIKTVGGLSVDQKKEILKNLYQSTPLIERAKSQIELAEIEINKIPKFGLLPPLSRYSDEARTQIPKAKAAFETLSFASKILPNLAGYPEPQVYFLMFQNNREMRPAGGFFGTYGEIKVKDGEIVSLKTNDPYNLDNRSKIFVQPPWQVPTLINPDTKSWHLRDSNWSPDFPTSAEKAMWFYHEEGGKEEFNGVISFSPTFLEYLLELTGPISIKDFPREFTSENVVDLIQYQTGQRFAEIGLKEEFRKEIIGELAKVLLKKIFELPKEKWPNLLQVLQRSIAEKHILLYFKNPEVQQFVEKQNWTGKIKTTDKDFLMVVDANVASLKTDEFVWRFFDYTIDFLDKDQAEVKLKLTYKNNAPGFTWKTTRYRNWNRIYVPLGSELVKISGNEKDKKYYGPLETDYEIIEEAGRLSIGTFISIEPGEEETLSYEYKLPKDLTRSLKNNYKLYFQKQAGVIKPGLKATIVSHKKIKSFSPETGKLLEDNKIEFLWDLNEDREFDLRF